MLPDIPGIFCGVKGDFHQSNCTYNYVGNQGYLLLTFLHFSRNLIVLDVCPELRRRSAHLTLLRCEERPPQTLA
jgi:hypothetical protein